MSDVRLYPLPTVKVPISAIFEMTIEPINPFPPKAGTVSVCGSDDTASPSWAPTVAMVTATARAILIKLTITMVTSCVDASYVNKKLHTLSSLNERSCQVSK